MHYVNCCFVFDPDGRIRVSTLNCSGTFHDSTIVEYGMYRKLENIYTDYDGLVVVESDFGVGDHDNLMKSSQQDPVGGPNVILINRAATSVRQLSGLGMGMIQTQFLRLKYPILLEEKGDRRIILTLMVHLVNNQTRKVKTNQILNSNMKSDDEFFAYGHIDENIDNYIQ